MADAINVQVAGTIRTLSGLSKSLLNPKPYLVMIAIELQRVARISFEEWQSPEGVKWQPLSRRYAAWKAKKMPGRGMLRASGQLIRTIFTGITANSAYISTANLPQAGSNQYGFDGNVTIAAHKRAAFKRRPAGGKRRTQKVRAHQVSSFTRHMRIPARPYLGFPPASEARMVADIERDLTARAGGTK